MRSVLASTQPSAIVTRRGTLLGLARVRSVAAGVLRWRVVLPVVVLLIGSYLAVLHPWLIAWGASPDEQQMRLPGDAVDPAPYVTRAIDIAAPPSAVWPWIVQMGQDRAGFYSNTWVENLFGSDIHNADSIHPEWQHRAIGDRVPLARPDLLFGLGASGHTDIVVLEPERAIGIIVGRFVLQPVGDNSTRLLFRESAQTQGPGAQGPAVVRVLVWDPAHFVMVHRVLEGIKERAEGRPMVPLGVQVIARVGWLVAGAGLLGMFLARRRWWPWLGVPAVVLIPPLLATGDLDATLAGFLAIGTTIAGGLAFGKRWWPAYVLIASLVLLVLLLAPDAYATLGLVFFMLAVATVSLVLAAVVAIATADTPGRSVESRPDGRYLMRTSVFRFLVLPLVASALALGAAVLLLMAGEGAPRRLAIAFNKHVLNPGMLWLATRRRTYYAAVHHVGRRSGRTYTTPVVAKLVGDDTMVIPLPYGPATDWCRNVLAAGGGTLTMQGREYRLSAPELVEASVGEGLVPAANAWLWHRVGIQQYLRLKADLEGAPAPLARAAEALASERPTSEAATTGAR